MTPRLVPGNGKKRGVAIFEPGPFDACLTVYPIR